MKIINIPRGYGKSTRAVWASELCDVPILTATERHKKLLKELAEKENVKMPDPITVSDLWKNKGGDTRFLERGIIIDEVFLVLTYLIYYVSGLNIPIKMVTFSEDQYKTINFEQSEGK